MKNLYALKGFTAFLCVLFINAFVDLGHKIIIQNTIFKIYDDQTQIILTAIVNGLILLPFILLFSPAGFISDRFSKPRVMQFSAAAAVLMTLIITLAYYLQWFTLAFAMTFLLAAQSAVYSPAKYGYIKELTGKEQLASANAIVQALTIIAILSGIFFFSILFETLLAGFSYHTEAEILALIAPLGWILVGLSIIELWQTTRLPEAGQPQESLRFDIKSYGRGQYLRNNLHKIVDHEVIWLAIIGLSVFWGVSQVMLAAFPAYAKASLQITNTVEIQGLLACSGIGIILGSMFAGRASRHHIETGLVPLGSIGLVVALLLLPGIERFEWLIAEFILFGFCGGMLIVPLNALMQFHAKHTELGTVIAGSNWVQNVVMLIFLILTALFALYGLSSLDLFNILTLTALFGAAYTLYHLPQSFTWYIGGRLFASRYRIEVLGLDNLPGSGGVLLLGNHISWLDWAMIQIACPRPVRFVMLRSLYSKWYLSRFLKFFGVIPISSSQSKSTLKTINQLLKNGEVVCLFPEGSITRNGHLGEFKRGYEKTIQDVDGVIVPFYLRGLWGSRFSRASEKSKEGGNPSLRGNVIVAFGKAIPITAQAHELKQAIFALSVDSWQAYARTLGPIGQEFLRSIRQRGRARCISDTHPQSSLSGYQLISKVLAFAGQIKKRSPERNIGIFMPASSLGIIVNLAVWLLGKTAVNLLKPQAEANIQTLYTSRTFFESQRKQSTFDDAAWSTVSIIYVEDLQQSITGYARQLYKLAAILMPANLLFTTFGHKISTDQPAAVLFNHYNKQSKAITLSQQSLLVNARQVADVLDTRHEDVMINTLPLHTATGLSVTTLLPLLEGLPLICQHAPGETTKIAKAIAQHQVTLLFTTPDILEQLTGHARIYPLMLSSLRLVATGSREYESRIINAFSAKFHQEVYTGYVADSTQLLASLNFPDRLDTDDWQVQVGNKPGTFGLPLPGNSFRIIDPENQQPLPAGESGLILIKTPQTMTDTFEKDYGRLDIDGYLSKQP